MKLNKTFGRVATTLVATAMLASLAAVPTFAEDIGSDGTIKNQTTSLDSVEFTKTYKMPAKVAVPDIDFTFAVSGVDPEGETKENSDQMDVPVKQGTAAITGDVVYAEDFTTPSVSGDIATYTQKVTLDLPEATEYDEPGVYKYEVTETPSVQNADLNCGKAHTLYVFVENGTSGLVITGVEFHKGNATEDKTDSWVNYYKLSGDPDDPDTPPTATANELTVAKYVDGKMANMSESFAFTVTIDSENEVTAYKDTATDTDGDGVIQDDEWTLGTNPISLADLTLANNERVHIYGLSKDDTYTISETKYNADGYKTTIKVDGSESNIDGEQQTFGTSNAKVEYTNTRTAVSPTGIVMNVAPYALLVVVAAAGCFVFLRKRRED